MSHGTLSLRTLKKTIRSVSTLATLLGVAACGTVPLSQTYDNFVFAAEQQIAQVPAGPIWYQEAVSYLGTAEIKGSGKSNSLIEKMHNLTSNAFGRSDGTAWCASFTNFVLYTTVQKFGLPEGYAGTGSSGARHFQSPANYDASRADMSYPGWGTNVALDDLHVGDVIAIIWDGGTAGHAGLVAATYVDVSGKVAGIWVLGGNQRAKTGNTETVNVALYMLDEAKRIVFKRPVDYKPDPTHVAKPLTKSEAEKQFGENIGQRGSLQTSR